MSLVITSQTVREGDRIQALKNEAVRRGIVTGLIKIVTKDSGLFSITIARRTGKLRQAFETAVRNIVNIKGSHTGKTVILWNEIKQATAAALSKLVKGEEYSKHHFDTRGFYVNPFTSGTFPMRLSRFKPMAQASMRQSINFELKRFGIDERVRFTV